ncbi:MAG: hypothetical protein HRT90_09355 [Candidatus Margulisbacteria bacterium]|nr:hypothetical protein [Candidatus Margulisiibacteriota bacterium]
MGVIKKYNLNKKEKSKEVRTGHERVSAGNPLSHITGHVIKGAVPRETVHVGKVKDVEEIEYVMPEENFEPVEEDIGDTISEDDMSLPAFDEVELNEEKEKRYQVIDVEIEKYKQKMISELDSEKEEFLEKAYQEGYDSGVVEGKESLKASSKELLDTIGLLAQEKSKVIKKGQSDILKLSVKIAEEILRKEMSLNQAVMVNLVMEAIDKVTDKDTVIIRVNRENLDVVKEHKTKLLHEIGDVKHFSIQEDSRVEPGGCIIETNSGYIDSTVSTKLDSILAAIMKVADEESQEKDT